MYRNTHKKLVEEIQIQSKEKIILQVSYLCCIGWLTFIYELSIRLLEEIPGGYYYDV